MHTPRWSLDRQRRQNHGRLLMRALTLLPLVK
jgi:hypothetical protein